MLVLLLSGTHSGLGSMYLSYMGTYYTFIVTHKFASMFTSPVDYVLYDHFTRWKTIQWILCIQGQDENVNSVEPGVACFADYIMNPWVSNSQTLSPQHCVSTGERSACTNPHSGIKGKRSGLFGFSSNQSELSWKEQISGCSNGAPAK